MHCREMTGTSVLSALYVEPMTCTKEKSSYSEQRLNDTSIFLHSLLQDGCQLVKIWIECRKLIEFG